MKVYVVNKWFHENYGYWLIDKIFLNLSDARAYILCQKAPDGSKEEFVNNYKKEYPEYYKGYNINEYPVFEKYTEIESVKIQLEIEEMKNKIKELESKL